MSWEEGRSCDVVLRADRLIAGTNEDGFIGRALNASRAYNDIIRSVAEAEDAANKAHQAAMDATAVRSIHISIDIEV